jgi:hypothetical protein
MIHFIESTNAWAAADAQQIFTNTQRRDEFHTTI